MRLSTALGRTLRQPPADAHLASHQLLVRAGFVRVQEGGLVSLLPLGVRAMQRLQQRARDELVRRGGQEVALPGGAPGPEWVQLVGREVDSYRQLPLLLFQLASRPTPHAGARGGLFGAAERPVVEMVASGDAHLAEQGPDLRAAVEAVTGACGVALRWAQGGAGETLAFFEHAAGDAELAACPGCGYAAERSWATAAWPAPPAAELLPPEEVVTPGCDTIATLAAFLEIPASQTLKMVFYSVEGKVTCLVIRGDRKADERKLARVLGTAWYYASLEEELEAIGAVGGYASPIGLDPRRVRVVADPSVRAGANFVSGANQPGVHIRNVNVPRDFVPGEWADLVLVEPGDPCPQCGTPLAVERAFELARGGAAAAVEAEYRDEGGLAQKLWMAGWQLDLGRLLAAVVESHHDEHGIAWPAACAPLDVHLVALDLREEAVARQAEALADRLRGEGLAVLYDDRDASAGVKFNDADLIGLPLRLTISKRWLSDPRTEAKWRTGAERLKWDDAELAAALGTLRRA